MPAGWPHTEPAPVAHRAEGVDRNLGFHTYLTSTGVALLAEGVDRNTVLLMALRPPAVALLAEGVDRNSCSRLMISSLSGRPPRGGRG